MDPDTLREIREAIRNIPDYPRPGVMFRDITTLLGNAPVFHQVVEELVHPWRNEHVDYVAGIEARGFILGGAVAHQLRAGFVPIRKKGKLPHTTVRVAYSLEYGLDEMEMHRDAVASVRAFSPPVSSSTCPISAAPRDLRRWRCPCGHLLPFADSSEPGAPQHSL